MSTPDRANIQEIIASLKELTKRSNDWMRLCGEARAERDELKAALAAAKLELSGERQHVRIYVADLTPEIWKEYHEKGTTHAGWRCLAHNAVSIVKNERDTLRTRAETAEAECAKLREDTKVLTKLETLVWNSKTNITALWPYRLNTDEKRMAIYAVPNKLECELAEGVELGDGGSLAEAVCNAMPQPEAGQ